MLNHEVQMTVLPRHLATFRDQLWQLFGIPNNTINTKGQTTVDFSGSDIPSQDYVVDWRVVQGHDMMRNAPLEIDGFLDAGRCVDAPGALRHQWA